MTCPAFAVTANTVSYSLFRSLCEEHGVPCRPIPVGARKTPDFEIEIDAEQILVEVKQLDSNEDDRRIELGVDTAGSIAPSQRVREQIAVGYRQLKSRARTDQCCLLVIYNNSGFHNYIDTWTVSTAMFGRYGIRIAPPRTPHEGIRTIGQGYMGNSRVNRHHCKGLSAIGILSNGTGGVPALDMYHNPFATNPLAPSLLNHIAAAQFMHNDPHGGAFVRWAPEKVGA